MSLRRRLVLITVAVVAIALVGADIGAYVALRSMLVSRVEQDLLNSAKASTKMVTDPGLVGRVDGLFEGRGSNTAYAAFDVKGAPIARAPAIGNDKRPLPDPVLPDLSTIPRLVLDGDGLTPPTSASITVPSSSGGYDYLMTSVETPAGWLMVVAMPLNETAATLGQLAVIEAAVTAVVLLLVALLATWAVGLGLRPLGRIEETAAAIAAGDLGRRIESVDRSTEVGRLGLALNSMLARIETALTAREASEQRLRRLVTDASHELRTPLTGIRGYASCSVAGRTSGRPTSPERCGASSPNPSGWPSWWTSSSSLPGSTRGRRCRRRRRISFGSFVRRSTPLA